jgi:hypothetical protein
MGSRAEFLTNSSSFGALNHPLFEFSEDLAKSISVGDRIKRRLSWLRVDGISPINGAFSHANLAQNLAAITKQSCHHRRSILSCLAPNQLDEELHWAVSTMSCHSPPPEGHREAPPPSVFAWRERSSSSTQTAAFSRVPTA